MILGSAAPRRFGRIAVALALALGGAGCGDDGTGVTPVAAIRFAAQPANIVAGQPFSLSVELLTAGGGVAPSANELVSLTLTGESALSGPTSVAASQGVASFAGLAITKSATNVRLAATSGGRTVTSGPFSVAVGAANSVRSTFEPTGFTMAANTSEPVTFAFADAFGNPLSQVPVTVATSLAGSAFVPSAGTTASDGTFATVLHATTGGASTLSATVNGDAIAFATPFAITELCPLTEMTFPGTVTGTLPAGACEVNGRIAAVYRFTTPSAGGASFNTTGAFVPRVEVKSGLGEGNPVFIATPQVPTAEWLLPAGTFLFRIAAQSGTGAYTIRGSAVAGNTGTTARAIIVSGTYGGQSLVISDRDFGDGTVYDYFFLFSTRPCTVTMRSTVFDTFLWMEDAVNLFFIADDDNGGGGTDARIQLNACNADGNPIAILANSALGPGGTALLGAYTLTVEFGNIVGSSRASSVSTQAVRADGPTERPAYAPLKRRRP